MLPREGNMTTTLRQLWVSLGFLLFLTLLLIPSPSLFLCAIVNNLPCTVRLVMREKKLQKWKQDDRERKIEEWEGCGPPVKTLVRRTACEEAAACQLDDCYCLPEHLMAGQCHSLYASRAHLTSFISMSRFDKTKQLIKDKSILLLLNTRNEFQLCICCLIFNWYFRLGLFWVFLLPPNWCF